MAHVEVLRGISDARVDKIVAMYRADGATDVQKEKQPDGTWTVTANFP